jgi:sec-independent protein translocase protein TatA
MPHIGMPELFVILALMLLVFGPKKLPEIARGIGQAIKEFKQAMHDTFSGEEAPVSVRASTAAPPGDRGEPLLPVQPLLGDGRKDTSDGDVHGSRVCDRAALGGVGTRRVDGGADRSEHRGEV